MKILIISGFLGAGITTFIKDGVMYVSNLEDNSWQKLDVSEEDINII